MKYLLDTNICIYIINVKPEKALRKFEQCPVYEFGIFTEKCLRLKSVKYVLVEWSACYFGE